MRMTAGQSSPREQRRIARTSRILDAAEQVFTDKGFEAATMEEVAEQAALAKGTLYLYFASKEDVFLGLALRTQDELLRRYGEAAADAQNGVDMLERILAAFHQVAVSRPEYFRLSISFWLQRTRPPQAQSEWWKRHVEHKRRLFRIVLRAMERGVVDGTVRDDVSPRHLALGIWGGALGGLMMALQQPRLYEELEIPARGAPSWRDQTALLVDAVRARPKPRKRKGR